MTERRWREGGKSVRSALPLVGLELSWDLELTCKKETRSVEKRCAQCACLVRLPA